MQIGNFTRKKNWNHKKQSSIQLFDEVGIQTTPAVKMKLKTQCIFVEVFTLGRSYKFFDLQKTLLKTHFAKKNLRKNKQIKKTFLGNL